jgi:hypothetical protein
MSHKRLLGYFSNLILEEGGINHRKSPLQGKS